MSSMTIEMLIARVESLEAQVVLLLKKGQDVPKSDDEVSGGDQEVVSKKEKKEKKAKKSDDKVSTGDQEVVSKKTTKKIKDETSSDDEDKPKKKRGTNGYILFSNANREDANTQLLVGTEKPKNTEVMKQLAQMWRALGDEEKEVWNAKAKETNTSEVN